MRFPEPRAWPRALPKVGPGRLPAPQASDRGPPRQHCRLRALPAPELPAGAGASRSKAAYGDWGGRFFAPCAGAVQVIGCVGRAAKDERCVGWPAVAAQLSRAERPPAAAI